MEETVKSVLCKKSIRNDIISNILDSYDYKLPLVVAEYFCYAFYQNITCKQRINQQIEMKLNIPSYKEFNNNNKISLVPSPSLIERQNILNNLVYDPTFYHPIYYLKYDS